MAIRIMASVWESAPVRGGELLVLLALADHANDTATCFPSVPRLAQRARLSVRQTQRVLRHLEHLGLLTRQPHAGRGGTDLFTVHTPDILTPPETTPMTPGGDTHDAGGVTPMTPVTIIEPSRSAKGDARIATREICRMLSASYPTHRRADEERVAAALNKVGRDLPPVGVLLHAIEHFKTTAKWTDKDGQFVPALPKWLRERHWEQVSPTTPTPPPEPDPPGWLDALLDLHPNSYTPRSFADLRRDHGDIAAEVLAKLAAPTSTNEGETP
jgi:hypothetical protein